MEVAASLTCWSAIPCRVSVEQVHADSSQTASQVEERLLERTNYTSGSSARRRARLKLPREMSESLCVEGARSPRRALRNRRAARFGGIVHPVIVGKRVPALDLSILFRLWSKPYFIPKIRHGLVRPKAIPVWATLQLAHLQDAMSSSRHGRFTRWSPRRTHSCTRR
jgi:hypothetical protein